MIRNILRFVVILGVVSVMSGGGVAALYGVFKAKIDNRELAEKRQGILAVCPDGAAVDPDHPLVGTPFEPDAVYAARDAAGKTVAYVASGETSGYSSVIKVVVGVRADDFRILRTVVVAQAETPGLGTQVAEATSNYTLWEKVFGPAEPGKTERQVNAFLERFQGKKADEIADIQGLTAATISSNATRKAVEQALQRAVQAAGAPHE